MSKLALTVKSTNKEAEVAFKATGADQLISEPAPSKTGKSQYVKIWGKIESGDDSNGPLSMRRSQFQRDSIISALWTFPSDATISNGVITLENGKTANLSKCRILEFRSIEPGVYINGELSLEDVQVDALPLYDENKNIIGVASSNGNPIFTVKCIVPMENSIKSSGRLDLKWENKTMSILPEKKINKDEDSMSLDVLITNMINASWYKNLDDEAQKSLVNKIDALFQLEPVMANDDTN